MNASRTALDVRARARACQPRPHRVGGGSVPQARRHCTSGGSCTTSVTGRRPWPSARATLRHGRRSPRRCGPGHDAAGLRPRVRRRRPGRRRWPWRSAQGSRSRPTREADCRPRRGGAGRHRRGRPRRRDERRHGAPHGDRPFDEFGIYTVSVFLALDATVDELCRDRPELQRYGKVRLTTAGRLRSLGFALVPTFDRPHYDVVLPDLDAARSTGSSSASTDRPEPGSCGSGLMLNRLLELLPLPHGAVGSVGRLSPPRRRRPHARQRGNARPGSTLTAGGHIIVGNEEADSGRRRGRANRRRRCRPACASCRARSRTPDAPTSGYRVVAEASALRGRRQGAVNFVTAIVPPVVRCDPWLSAVVSCCAPSDRADPTGAREGVDRADHIVVSSGMSSVEVLGSS